MLLHRRMAFAVDLMIGHYNEIYPRASLSFVSSLVLKQGSFQDDLIVVEARSGSVKSTPMQAYAVQGMLIGLPGLGVCPKFLIETITNRNE